MKRLALAPFAAGAAALTITSAAFACTTVMGSTSINPTSGKPGSTITATGSGTGRLTTFGLYFLNYKSDQDAMLTCMGKTSGLPNGDVKIGGNTTSDVFGNIKATTGTIPSSAGTNSPDPAGKTGLAQICFIQQSLLGGADYGGYATNSASFTVT